VVKKLHAQINNESIIQLDDWSQLGKAALSGAIWVDSAEELKQMWLEAQAIKALLRSVEAMERKMLAKGADATADTVVQNNISSQQLDDFNLS